MGAPEFRMRFKSRWVRLLTFYPMWGFACLLTLWRVFEGSVAALIDGTKENWK